MQLMENYCPYAAGLLCILVPTFEPLGFETPLVKQQPITLLTFPYTPTIVAAIALTAVLGLLVSLSTFLVNGATSSLTYNVVSTSLLGAPVLQSYGLHGRHSGLCPLENVQSPVARCQSQRRKMSRCCVIAWLVAV